MNITLNLMSRRLLPMITALVFMACERTPTIIGDYSGTLLGKVQIYNERTKLLPDASGVEIRILGTSIVTYSDPAGNWQFNSLPTGRYDIRFSKPGYLGATSKAFPFLGGGVVRFGQSYDRRQGQTYYPVGLVATPRYSPILAACISNASGQVTLYWTTTSPVPDSVKVDLTVFVGHSPNISPKAPATYSTRFQLYEDVSAQRDSLYSFASLVYL